MGQLLCPTSKAAYQRAWRRLTQFMRSSALPLKLPLPSASVALYCAYMEDRGFAAATVATDVSAFAFVHKLLRHPNPGSSFVVQSILSAMRKKSPPDSRAPISRELLEKLIEQLSVRFGKTYNFFLFRAIFCVAFFGFCRIGEVVKTTTDGHALRLGDVQVNSQEVVLTFQSYKHSSSSAKATMRTSPGRASCPVIAVGDYLAIRPKWVRSHSRAVHPMGVGPSSHLFIHPDGAMVTAYQVTSLLKSLCVLLGEAGRFDGHSFRIGATTHAAGTGRTALDIQSMGRWKSDAYRKYIRGSTAL